MSFCPIVKNIDYSTTTLQIEDPFYPLNNWNEISGTAISPTQIGPSGYPVMFGHNDGPESTKTFGAWDSGTGKRLKTINLDTNNPNNIPLRHEDWEDMTIGKCGPDTEESCIYIADTGDNRAQGSGHETQRSRDRPYTIYKIREPVLDNNIFDNSTYLVEDHVSVLQFDYSHVSSPTPYANCEAMFIDHFGWGEDAQIGDLYLVTKWNTDKSHRWNRLFQIPASAWPNGFGKVATYAPFTVGEYGINGLGTFFDFTWTGADMSLDGTKIALTWTNETHVFVRCPNQTVASALVGGDAIYSCAQYINPPNGANPGNQYESVSFFPDGKGILNLAESLDPPNIVHVDLIYEPSDTSRNSEYCPGYLPPSIQVPTVLIGDDDSTTPTTTTTDILGADSDFEPIVLVSSSSSSQASRRRLVQLETTTGSLLLLIFMTMRFLSRI